MAERFCISYKDFVAQCKKDGIEPPDKRYFLAMVMRSGAIAEIHPDDWHPYLPLAIGSYDYENLKRREFNKVEKKLQAQAQAQEQAMVTTNPSTNPGFHPGRVLLVDGSNLLHRAWHGFRQDVYAPDGKNVRGVNGFSSMLANILANYRPEMVVVALEPKDGGKVWRDDEYTEYKAQRRKAQAAGLTDDGQIREQIPLVEKMLTFMGIKCLWAYFQEADDVLSALTHRALYARFTDIIVYSGDKDLLQLCQDPDVTVAQPRSGNEPDRLWKYSDFLKVYGFEPKFLPDFKALVGDASDNLKGVNGIGEVGAGNLVQAFGSLESAIEWIFSEQDARHIVTLENGKQIKLRAKRYAQLMEPDVIARARLMKKLATLKTSIIAYRDVNCEPVSTTSLAYKESWYDHFRIGADMQRQALANYMSQDLGIQYVTRRTQMLFDLADAIARAKDVSEVTTDIPPVGLPAYDRHEESEEKREFSRDATGQLVMF
jgi:5'-3' exonuclease